MTKGRQKAVYNDSSEVHENEDELPTLTEQSGCIADESRHEVRVRVHPGAVVAPASCQSHRPVGVDSELRKDQGKAESRGEHQRGRHEVSDRWAVSQGAAADEQSTDDAGDHPRHGLMWEVSGDVTAGDGHGGEDDEEKRLVKTCRDSTAEEENTHFSEGGYSDSKASKQ